MTKLITLAAGALLSLVVIASRDDSAPHCPTEDSCTIDYRDGAWHVEEATP